MRHRRTALLAALGLLAPAALISSAAGAVDQDLVVSATAGPPGTVVTVSSASCTSTDDTEAYLSVALRTGTAPDELLAGLGQGFEGSATITVPDWVDPDQPAVIEATCETYGGETSDTLDYDPVPFDVEPGSGAPIQVRTLSRNELLAGQGLLVSGSCGAAFPNAIVAVVVGEGGDLSGRQPRGYAGDNFIVTEADGSFELPVVVSNAMAGFEAGATDGVVDELGIYEEPMDLDPGDYTVLTYCMAEASFLVLEPGALTVTGTAPTGAVDLVAADGTNEVTAAGECATGPVSGWFQGLSAETIESSFVDARAGAPRPSLPRALGIEGAPDGGDGRVSVHPGARLAMANRLVPDDAFVDYAVDPGPDGAWSHTDTTAFDFGVVIGQAACGDPFADGHVYDPQGAVVDVADEPTTTVPQLVPPTVPAPPAGAVPGTPTYAG